MYSGIRLRALSAYSLQESWLKNWSLVGMLLALLLTLTIAGPVTAAERVPLKYGWEQEQQYAYQVKIDVTLENYSEIMTGVSQYDVVKSDADSFAVQCTGKLNSITKSKNRRMLIPPMRMLRHRSPFAGMSHSMLGAFEPHVLELNRFGEINTVKGSSLLPYLIGHLSQINLIPLSPKGDAEWSESEKTSVSVISSDRIPLPFRDSNVEKTLGAKQTTEYKITEEKGDDVTLAVTHSYRTVATVDGDPEIELSGTGTIHFDKKQGGVISLELNYKMFRRTETSVHKIPITISSKQLSKEELARYRADQQELQKKHQAEMKKREEASQFEIPENIDADLKDILTDLATKNNLKRKAALKKLSQAKPKQETPEVSQILIQLLNSKDITIVADTSEALVVWSTKADVPAMIEVLPEVNILGLENVSEAILKHKTPDGVKAVASLMKNPIKGHKISPKLIAYGSGAEEGVLDQLDPSNFVVLVGVLRVLKEIGTEKTLKKIEEITRTTDDASFRLHTAATVKAIEARVNKAKS